MLAFVHMVSAEIFQKYLLEGLYGLDGVIGVADDIILHGYSVEEQDKHLVRFRLCVKKKL